MYIKVMKEFTDAPGGRYKAHGPFSAEEFRTTILDPKYRECLSKNEHLIIDLDGGYGYTTPFLEESFGGMVRLGHDAKEMLKTIQIISNDEPYLKEKIERYILENKEFVLSKRQ